MLTVIDTILIVRRECTCDVKWNWWAERSNTFFSCRSDLRIVSNRENVDRSAAAAAAAGAGGMAKVTNFLVIRSSCSLDWASLCWKGLSSKPVCHQSRVPWPIRLHRTYAIYRLLVINYWRCWWSTRDEREMKSDRCLSFLFFSSWGENSTKECYLENEGNECVRLKLQFATIV